MNQETIEYYDKASKNYSAMRYGGQTQSFFQYLFKRRLSLFLSFLESIEKDIPSHASILEIGCADGVVLKAIEKRFPGRFSRLVGMDISPGMIDQATKKNSNPRATFFLRDNLPADGQFDVVVELGVGTSDLDEELRYVSSHLTPRGFFFYEVSGSKSLYTRLKNKDAYYVKDYKAYRVYEASFSKYFSIKKSRAYGLFVPKLWAAPFLARFFQPIFDFVFTPATPSLFHERLYLLKSTRETTFEKE